MSFSVGTGGRSSVSGSIASVFGCTGFLGRYLVNNLGRSGTQTVIPYRGCDDDKRHLKVMGDLGQIVPMKFNPLSIDSMRDCLRSSDIVYNLMGRMYPTKNFSLEKVHVELAREIAKLCKETGARLVHVSALNADVNSSCQFLKAKALGEQAVLQELPDATIVRSSYMYGDEDRFWNRLGSQSRWKGGIFLPGSGHVRSRPVYVGDVAAIMAKMVKDNRADGRIVELFGPKEYYYKDLVQLFLDVSGRAAEARPVPKVIYKIIAGLFEKLKFFPIITSDEVERVDFNNLKRQLFIDDVLSKDALTFQDFEYKPHSVEETISRFVRMYRPAKLQRIPLEENIKSYAINENN